MNISDDVQENTGDKLPPESFVQAIFTGFGSVLFNLTVGKQVTPLQLIALGEYLTLLGKRQINQALTQQEEILQRNKIFVPGMDTDGLKL